MLITRGSRVLTRNLRDSFPEGQIELGFVEFRLARSDAGIAEATQALDEHGLSGQGIVAINQIIERLIVRRRSQVKELFNGALLYSCMAPP